jgi:hypothetical protein
LAYVPQYHHDVFISYAHRDELTADEKPGWVSAFEAALRIELGAALGDDPVIWFDRNRLKPGFVLSHTIRYDLSRTAIFLKLESPSYWQSPYCNQEFEWFSSPELPLDSIQIEDRSRIISVIVRPSGAPYSPDRIDAEFHERAVPLDPSGPQFRARIARLAQTLAESLTMMELRRTPIYMPKPGIEDEDCAKTWNSLANELKARNFRHIPRIIRPSESDDQIIDEVNTAPLSVHLIGAPWNSRAERRLRLAQQVGRPVLVWISPAARRVATQDQGAFLDTLASAGGVDVLEKSGIQAIKEIIDLRLKPQPESPAQALKTTAVQPANTGQGIRNLYLICDTRDRKSRAWTLKEKFESKGIEVLLPEIGAPDAQEIRRDHLKKLKTTDGVLLFYHTAGKRWFEQTWREVNDLEDMRGEPWRVQALCLVQPPEKDAWVRRATDAGYTVAGAGLSRKLILMGDDTIEPLFAAGASA